LNGQLDKVYNFYDDESGEENSSNNLVNEKESNTNIKYIKEENQEKALLKGILLGEKEELTDEQVNNFKISNLSHILAVSGMHIAYIIMGTLFTLKLFNISKQKIHILTTIVIIFFMFLTEFTPSVVRASIMAIFVLIAFILKRKSDVWINMSIASLLTLIYNPYILFSLSYQLSYLGTIGIILGIQMLNEYRQRKLITGENSLEETVQKSIPKISKESLENKVLDNEKRDNLNRINTKNGSNKNYREKHIETLNKIKQFFIDTVIVCLSAQFFVAPIILLNFNTFSIYFLISNVLVAPIMGVITILGFVVIFISYIFFPTAVCLNYIENLLLKFINIMTNFISNLPNSIIYLKTPYVLSIIIYFAIILVFVGFYITQNAIIKRILKKHRKSLIKIFRNFLIIYLIVVLLIDLNFFVFNTTKIYFIDVGQGDCSLMVTEKNKKILIDGGGSSNDSYDVGENVTLPYLLDRRISKLDYVVISHFDSDHVQGLYAVLENLKVKNVIISKQYENTDNFQKFLNIVKERNINLIIVKIGDVIQIDKYSRLEILFPLKNTNGYITQNAINNNSIVCKYLDRNISILYTGDIEEVAEQALIKLYKRTNKLKADILKVAHHGSKSSTIDGFIDLVKPKIAVISAGRNNTFGHPHEVVLERLEKQKILIRRTDIEGEIELHF